MSRHAHAPVDTVVGDRVVRFDRVERVVHWLTTIPMLVLVVTGLILYVGPLATAVGRRDLVKDVHVVFGMTLVVPVGVALATKWGDGLRRNIDRFANWHDDDVRWFRRRTRKTAATGKFNGGQKANAVFVGGAMVVMLVTGSIMKWFGPFPLSWRTGATFAHDWFAVGLWIVIPGHILMALLRPRSMRAMWTGWVSLDDARAKPRWHRTLRDADDAALVGPDAGADSTVGEAHR